MSVTMPSGKKKIYKFIVIGDANVGKTCLTYRFCEGRFPKNTEATIGVDFREKTIKIENDEIKIQLWDTAGQERFRKSMVPHYYRNAHAIIFVYDVTKVDTFNHLSEWINECNLHCVPASLPPPTASSQSNQTDATSVSPSSSSSASHSVPPPPHTQSTATANYIIPRVVVGNKCDSPTNSIVVNTHLAQRFADSHNMPLFETSAKDDSMCDHVEGIFYTLAHKLRASQSMILAGGASDYQERVNQNRAGATGVKYELSSTGDSSSVINLAPNTGNAENGQPSSYCYC